MTLTLRQRIFLTLVPLLLLLAVLGTAGVILLLRLGDSVRAILRENYVSVIAMEKLNDAVERIDSSFQFALSGQLEQARRQYAENLRLYQENLEVEKNNITLPGEQQLFEELKRMTEVYRSKADAFYSLAPGNLRAKAAYYGPSGLLETFDQIKRTSAAILHLNQANMEKASRDAKRLALSSSVGFALALGAAIILAGLSSWHTVRTILRPIEAMTQAMLGIGAGNLNQLVPYQSADELGQLAQAFNQMARRLRDYRKSQSAQLLRAQETSQATVDSFTDPVIVVDSEGYVEVANPAARRLLGVLPKHDGQPMAGVWQAPEPLRQPLADALQNQSDFTPEGFDHVILLGYEGRERALLPRIMSIRDPYGSTLGAAVLLQDVTRLRLLDQVKSNLVATASHELKTPLTSIRLAIHLLLEETVGPLSPKQMELLLDARENCERLLAMVNNLLDLARLEQGWRQLNLRPERPETLLRAAADAFLPRARDQSVEIVLEIPQELPEVMIDAGRLGSALANLLDNALTYTDRGGRIVLSASATQDGVTLSVADTGVGIPPEHLPHVFEKFFRVPGQSKGIGTGLGLAIVHEVVVAHGGTISCESAPGKGTVFRMSLPIMHENRLRAAGSGQPGPSAQLSVSAPNETPK